MSASGNDFNFQSNISASVKFNITVGGVYTVAALATWGGGSLHLQAVLPDGATLIDVGTSSNFTANGYATGVYLCPGQYQWTVTTSTAVYCSAVRCGTG